MEENKIKKEKKSKLRTLIVPKTIVSFARDDNGNLIPYNVDMELTQGHNWRVLPEFHARVEEILNSLNGVEWE